MDLLGFGKKAQRLEEFKAQGAVIIDVRTPDEYKRGHAPGSMNVPLSQLDGKLKKIKALSKPVITCCASGMRSSSAASKLKSEGIDAINGGAWQALT